MFSKSVLFHFIVKSLRLFVPQVECHNLGFVWACMQIVGSVVLWEFTQRFFNSCFHFYERAFLSCDTQIVCVYEATCSVVERLVISVDVEKDGGQDNSLWQVVLLFSPSTTLNVQFHIEPPTGQHVLDYST